MGTLYTTYPVLVLTEVTPGAHPYTLSGWCSSEFLSAMLMQKLRTYSAQVLDEYMSSKYEQSLAVGKTKSMEVKDNMVEALKSGDFHTEVVVEFESWFQGELETKIFFSESDRSIVHGIVLGFVRQRQLKDAIKNQKIEYVR